MLLIFHLPMIFEFWTRFSFVKLIPDTINLFSGGPATD